MKHNLKARILLPILIIVLLVGSAFAPMHQLTFDELVALLAQMAGVAALITFLVNAAKRFGWIQDGSAGVVTAGLNILVLALLWGVTTFLPGVDLSIIDRFASLLAQLGGIILPIVFVVQILASKFTHATVRGVVPVFGFSYSAARGGKG